MSKRLLVALVTVFSCGVFFFASTSRAEGDMADAEKVYKKHCKKCHAMDGKGKKKSGEWLSVHKTLKLEKPEVLDIVSKDFTDEEIMKSMTDGKGKMKAMKDKMSEDDMKKATEYTKHLRAQAKK